MISSVLNAAEELIHGDRAADYGPARENFSTIAALWRVYLIRRGIITIENDNTLGPEDVCMLMALLKVARIAQSPDHEDSLVDAIGYLALVEKCRGERDE